MDIKTIAKLSGVSSATVSRYLNGGYVSQEKKEIIKKVIDETGYKPMREAIMLRTKKSKQIGVIIPKINSNSISSMVRGISKVLNENDYYLLLADTYNNENDEIKYLNVFKENNLDGIILIGTVLTNEHRKLFNELNIPIVLLSQYDEEIPCVYFNDTLASKKMTSLIIDNRLCPSMIGARLDDIAVGLNRKKGFLDALEQANIQFDENNYEISTFDINGGYNAIKKILERNPNVDCCFCATETIACGALKYLHEINKKIPEDFTLGTVGSGVMSEASYPTISCCQFFYEEAGEESAKMILSLIDNKTYCNSLQINFKMYARNTTNNN